MTKNVFTGCMPALLTPCTPDRKPDYDKLVAKGQELVGLGMSAVIYCGSMGDWPLLTDAERMEGVARLCAAGVPVVVGTGAVNTSVAVAHARHAAEVGALGLMVIPRVLARGPSIAAQKAHFEAILSAAPTLPSVIYNSPYYGFSTRADLFYALRAAHPNLVGFKEFGGFDDLRYAAENITSQDADGTLMIGVDEGKLDEALEIIKKQSSRRRIVTVPATGIPHNIDSVAMPMTVTVGGATVFVLEVENSFKF